MSDDDEQLHDYGPVHASWDEGYAYAWDGHDGLHDVGKLEEVADGYQWRVPVPRDPDEVVAMVVRYHTAITVLAMCRNPMEMLQEIYGIDDRRGLPGMPRIRAALDKCLEHYALREHFKPPLHSRKSEGT